jgi:hypothetical protein
MRFAFLIILAICSCFIFGLALANAAFTYATGHDLLMIASDTFEAFILVAYALVALVAAVTLAIKEA